jgi:Zn/Cd-binding protein ZinT
VRERRRGFLLLLLRWPLRWDHERTAAEERKEESQAKGRMGLRGQSRAERERGLRHWRGKWQSFCPLLFSEHVKKKEWRDTGGRD